MTESPFPELRLETWRATRDTLHGYCKVLGAIRRATSRRQRHWGHITLQTTAEGLTTTPIPASGSSVELRLDLTRHRLEIVASGGERHEQALEGQSAVRFHSEILAVLERLGLQPEVDTSTFADEVAGEWNRQAIDNFWRAWVQIDAIFKTFKGERRHETSPVQLFPHHFDLALSWYSGRLVPDQDPADEERSDEQMTFGFTTGDAEIAEPYFYATAYPQPEGFVGSDLPAEADWHEEGFSGAVLRYARLVDSTRAHDLLLSFLRMAHAAGAPRMKPQAQSSPPLPQL